MKKGAVLLNFVRGELFDIEAVCDAIESKRLGGVHLDVYEGEPKTSTAEFDVGRLRMLAGTRNVSLSCHAGAQTEEGQTRAAMELVTKVRLQLDAREVAAVADMPRARARPPPPPPPRVPRTAGTG